VARKSGNLVIDELQKELKESKQAAQKKA